MVRRKPQTICVQKTVNPIAPSTESTEYILFIFISLGFSTFILCLGLLRSRLMLILHIPCRNNKKGLNTEMIIELLYFTTSLSYMS